MTPRHKTLRAFATLALFFSIFNPAQAEEVGEIGVDWLGNDIIIEAVPDPDVEGVTCHVAYFERGLIDRLQKETGLKILRIPRLTVAKPGPFALVISTVARAAKRFSKAAGH